MLGPPYCQTCLVWAKIVEKPLFDKNGQYTHCAVTKPWHCPKCGEQGKNIACYPRADIIDYQTLTIKTK